MNKNYEDGRAFEEDFAKRIGAKIQPGSGNQWHAKLDVKGRSFLWSLKSTTKISFRITKDMWKELVHSAFGSGGTGGNTIPGLAIRMHDEDYVMLRLGDFITIVQEDIKIAPASKRSAKIEQARVPVFQRKAHDEEEEPAT